MKSMGIPIRDFVTLTRSSVENLVIVTGVSSNHFNESLDAIASTQQQMPDYNIIYYDLGLNANQASEVKRLCNVKYRKFNYDIYPKHIKNLKNYAFKAVLIQEVFQTFSGVLWMDASVRWMKNLTSIYPQVLQTDGFLQFEFCTHSNAAVTHPGLYAYIPTNTRKQQHVPCLAATSILWYRTNTTYWSLFHWWLLCALDEDCIAPKGSSLECKFDRFGTDRYAGCHRYDQSVLNLLTSNLFGYNIQRYISGDRQIHMYIRKPSGLYPVKHCATKTKFGGILNPMNP